MYVYTTDKIMSDSKDLGLAGTSLQQPTAEQQKLSGMKFGNTGPSDLLLNQVTFESKFVVLVDGKPASSPLATMHLAEQFINSLPAEKQSISEIISTDANGKQLLLG